MTKKVMQTLYSWQQDNWKTMVSLYRQNRLPHALLIDGPAAIGKSDFCKQFAAWMLCFKQNEMTKACGQCKACHLFVAGNHPDYYLTEPDGQTIKIEQIRFINEKLTQTQQISTNKLILIEDAEKMNTACANAFLKSLEEPAANNTYIILIVKNSARLLPTVKSRCQQLKMTKPTFLEIKQWLQSFPQENAHLIDLAIAIADCAPLKARFLLDEPKQITHYISFLIGIHAILEENENPLSIAGKWSALELDEFFSICSFWLSELIYYATNKQFRKHLSDEIENHLKEINNHINLLFLFELLDFIYNAKEKYYARINLNKELFLERFFSKFSG